MEAVVPVDLETELVASAVPVRVLGELLGRRGQLVPRRGHLDTLLLELIGPVVERVGVEVEHHGHVGVVELHRFERARRVGVLDRLTVELTAGEVAQVGEDPLRGERRDPRHVHRGHVGRVVRRHLNRELLVHRVPVAGFVFHGDPWVLALETCDDLLGEGRRLSVVVQHGYRHGLVRPARLARSTVARARGPKESHDREHRQRSPHDRSPLAHPPAGPAFRSVIPRSSSLSLHVRRVVGAPSRVPTQQRP